MAETLNSINSKHRIFKKIGKIIAIIFLSLGVTALGVLIFQKTFYTPFWVNGQSMYPTLNKNAKYVSNGQLVGERNTKGEHTQYDVDYGFMVTDKNSLSHLSRFDIVVTKYTDTQDSYNIKRVIVLPGETFYITSTSDKTNGSLYVKNVNNEFELISQPIEEEYIYKGTYPTKYTVETTLGEDEVFVMGDNRIEGNSYDSRSVGPIKQSLIHGIAVGLNAYATIGYDSNNELTPTSTSHYWPRFF